MTERNRGRRAIRRLAVLAFAIAVAGRAGAGDGGTLDVEIANRAAVNGAIGAPRELDTLRLRVPENAAISFVARGSGRVKPDVRLVGPDGAQIDLGASLRVKGRTASVASFVPGPAGLYRIDVRSQGTTTGNYRLDASWRLPPRETFSGATADAGAFYVFDAEAGTRIDVDLAALDAGATVRIVGISGPHSFELPYDPPSSPSSRVRARTPPLPSTGRYRLDLVTDVAGRRISGSVTRRAPTKTTRVNLRGAERRGAGVARTVSRKFDADGGTVDVPRLEAEQRVSLDASGVCLAIPAGGLDLPTSVLLRTDDHDIGDPLGFAPAGVSVHFDSGGAAFRDSVDITLPYDVGAFAAGDVLTSICVLRRADDGGVFELPRSSYVVDADAGLVTFPTSTFSSYQVFSPPVELTEVALAGRPNDLTVPPDEAVVYLSTDVLTSALPAAAVMRHVPGGAFELYAGGGSQTGDGVFRLDYDFDADIGGSGAIVSALSAGPQGLLLVVTGDVGRTRSLVYVVRPDGIVVRVAGDGTADLDESLPARQTGLPFCCGAAFDADTNVVVVTDAFVYPVSDRVLFIYADTPGLDGIRVATVAGGGDVDVSGAAPLATRLLQPRAVLVDADGRIVVGDRDWLVRFDLALGTTTTLAGTNFGETDTGGEGRTIGGVGAPLRTVVLGAIDDLAFAPGRDDILYAADPEAGIVWRLDLARDRAFIAAGRRVDFGRKLTTREPSPGSVDPGEPLNFPVAVAPLGDEVFIAERFDDRLFSLHRKP